MIEGRRTTTWLNVGVLSDNSCDGVNCLVAREFLALKAAQRANCRTEARGDVILDDDMKQCVGLKVASTRLLRHMEVQG